MLNINAISLELGSYLAGFTDGEGSFNISFRPRKDYKLPWKLSLCFNISQRDQSILRICQKTLSCGTMRQRQDGVWYYEVNKFTDLQQNIIPFFDRFSFCSNKKKRDFAIFKQMAELIENGSHRTSKGIREILVLREDMNDGGKRRYSSSEICESLWILRDYTPNYATA